MRRVLLPMMAILCCLTLHISAQTTWIGATDNDWFTATNWSAGLPNAGNNAIIPATFSPEITLTANYVFDFNIQNDGTLQMVLDGFSLNNNGILQNNNTLEINGAGAFSNLAIVENNGNINSNSIFTNSFGATLTNDGSFVSTAQFINFQTFNNVGGLFSSMSDFDNGGIVTNDAVFINTGLLENLGGATFNNNNFLQNTTSGNFSNFGDVVNNGTINNDEYFLNSGLINNLNGGMINNNVVFINQNTIINAAVITNTSCAILRTEDGSSSTNIGSGELNNQAIIYQLGAAIVDITNQNGLILTDNNDFVMPTAVCVDTIQYVLDNNSNSHILTPSEVDNGSSADYCFIDSLGLSKTEFGCAEVGEEMVTLTVIDGNGTPATCQTVVRVQDMDAPEITCPVDIEIDLEAGECGQIVTFDVTATDNCDTIVITQLDDTGLNSGDLFPIGTTTLMFNAFDGSIASSCSFQVIINEFATTPGLICNNQLNYSIDQNCEGFLTIDQLMEGEQGCADDYAISINGVLGNEVTMALVGQNVEFMVQYLETGNMCWGNLLVEDKLAPTCTLPGSGGIIFINCTQNSAPISEGGDVEEPIFTDCLAVTATYEDETQLGECTDTFLATITRTWIATDAYGNETICQQTIIINRTLMADITLVCPAEYTTECVIGSIPDLSPEVTGYPLFEMENILVEMTPNAEAICAIDVLFNDNILPSCDGSIRIMRTWMVSNTCEPFSASNPWQCTQFINVTDHTAPVIITIDTLFVNTDIDNCSAIPTLPSADFMDCSSEITWETQTTIGNIMGNGGNVPAPGLATGEHLINYIATDACGNSSVAVLVVIVEDNVPPIPVCDEHTVVALTSEGYGEATAISFDDGSSDNCCIDSFFVQRVEDFCDNPSNLIYDETVTFCCEDIGQETMVRLLVKDCNGNTNFCMINVTVQNQIDPEIVCPADLTITCPADPYDLNLTGNATATDNCAEVTISHEDAANINCGNGTITRTFTAVDANGNTASCTQNIFLINPDPFTCDDIEWPADYIGTGCSTGINPTIAGEPIINNDACASIAVTYVDEEVEFPTTGACFKYIRTWTVVEYCTNLLCEYTQNIEIANNDAPAIGACNDRDFCNVGDDCAPLMIDLTIDVSDDCTPNNELQITWTVDENNDGIADIGSEFSGFGMNTGNEYILGTHSISYTIIDLCGNEASCSFLFTIEDCGIPSLTCNTNITATIFFGNKITIQADIVANSSIVSDNCTNFEDLHFSFSDNLNDIYRTFFCDDLGEQAVDLVVTDEQGNQAMCTITVIVDDTLNLCNSNLMIAGNIHNEEGEEIADISVGLTGDSLLNYMTDNEGHYEFAEMPTGNYNLLPQKNNDLLNGVTTYDIVLLNRHILNTQLLDSPYKIIAADVNHSNDVTAADMVALRAAILGINDYFPNNTAWRFVGATHQFDDANNPLAASFPENMALNNVAADMMENNFIGIKVGDLNGTAIVNINQAAAERSTGYLDLEINDQNVKKDALIEVPVYAKNMTEVAAYQFTMNFDATNLIFEKMTPSTVTKRYNYGFTFLEKGAITTSWDTNSPVIEEEKCLLFTLTFRARENVFLSDALSINSRFTRAEAYGKNDELLDVQLRFQNEEANTVANKLMLYQNRPNPFREATVIGFDLPANSAVTITIYDLSGKVLKVMNNDLSKGYHEVAIRHEELGVRGVFYYEVKTATHIATKKMILTN